MVLSSLLCLQYKIVKLLHYPTITKTAFLLYEKTKVRCVLAFSFSSYALVTLRV
jgi:hypothetical protein